MPSGFKQRGIRVNMTQPEARALLAAAAALMKDMTAFQIAFPQTVQRKTVLNAIRTLTAAVNNPPPPEKMTGVRLTALRNRKRKVNASLAASP